MSAWELSTNHHPQASLRKEDVVLKDVCSTLSFATVVAKGCAKASGDSFWEEIQGKKFLTDLFKKRCREYQSRESFSFARIKWHPDQAKINQNPEFGILGPSAVENMEISWKYAGCKESPAWAANGRHHWAKQEWKPRWKSRVDSKKWNEKK